MRKGKTGSCSLWEYMVGFRLRWNVGNFPIDCDTESLADGDNAVSQSVPPQLDEEF